MNISAITRTELTSSLGKPSAKLIAAASTVLVATAYADTIRPVIEAHKGQALAEREYFIAPEWIEAGLPAGRITDPASAYEMEQADFHTYYTRCAELHRAAGFVFANECCPLLIAEREQTDAERAFIKTSQELKTGVDTARLYNLDHRSQYLSLTMSYVTGFIS